MTRSPSSTTRVPTLHAYLSDEVMTLVADDALRAEIFAIYPMPAVG